MSMMDMMTRQGLACNHPRDDPSLHVFSRGERWFIDIELPRGENPRVDEERAEKERQVEKEITEMWGKMDKLENAVRKYYSINSYVLELEG